MVIGAIVAIRDTTVPPGARYAKFFVRLISVAIAIAVILSTGPTVLAASARLQTSPWAFLPFVIMVLGEVVARVWSEMIIERSNIRLVKISSRDDPKA